MVYIAKDLNLSGISPSKRNTSAHLRFETRRIHINIDTNEYQYTTKFPCVAKMHIMRSEQIGVIYLYT